ncbi:major capsid protein [Puniceibacterium sp. IMCC21224]|uniref:major capsid protein n=1 Tax=Puniceibacterium sp. IMCC21224 TaxID=1618204 RepID=UPI00064DE60E|nr:major capsid protein [Puniceibacterium sp. IMCC21224]KMK68574.1 Phage major capsid protein E [Puniceibacterium sp. IMCC21224]
MNQTVLNTRTAGVIDPILSTHARGYRNLEFISQLLFPRVPIPNRAMRVLKFGKESFRMVNTRRAPGADKKRIQYGYASDPVSLVQDALEALVPVEHQEEAQSIPGIDLSANAVSMVLDVLDLGLEFECANMARTAASYDGNHKLALTGTDRWTASASTPFADVRDANEAIRGSIGRYGNTLALSPSAFNGLCDHPDIRDAFKYTSKDSITVEMLAAYFRIPKVIVGKAVYLPETAAESEMATDVWGDDAILAYVPMTGDNFMVPAYGYTYELRGYPQVQTGYFENSNDSWIYPTKVERRPYIVGIEGGFLFQNAGAAAS